jgi:clan AA aspartic protease (TIGR02281 family)
MIKYILLFFCFFYNNLYSQTIIKMKNENGVSTLPCKVNGLKLNFIFDTGASGVSLSMSEAMFMFKNGYLSKEDIIGKTDFQDANGEINEGIVINIKEIEIAGIKLDNVNASIVKNYKAPLLLGQSAIKKLGGINLDLNSNTITILNGQNKSINFSEENSTNKSTKLNSIIIGNTYKIGKFEVAEFDFKDPMSWYDAIKACKELGEGWRLPGRLELDEMFKERKKISASNFYWSSVEDETGKLAWGRNFEHSSRKGFSSKGNTAYVRAIRNL